MGHQRGPPKEVIVELGKGGVRVEEGGRAPWVRVVRGDRGRRSRFLYPVVVNVTPEKRHCLQPAAMAESWALRFRSSRLAGPRLPCSGAQTGFCK